MKDVGLVSGVKALWQEDLLWDYTINVQGQEFKAHKVVLASVSQYFKAMLSDGFIESKTDDIELKGLSADVVSKVLKFIYTGDENIIGTDPLDILSCVMYLQMPLVADICVEKLLESLNSKNCLQIYSMFVEYSFNEGADKVNQFINVNWDTVFEVCRVEELSHDAVQVLIDYWEKTEWDMFLFIKDWFSKENVPEFDKDDHPIGIEVNNFLIIWTGTRTRKWHIFDPRTLKWSTMADMEKMTTNFVLLNHGEYLYTVGGYSLKPSLDPQFKYTNEVADAIDTWKPSLDPQYWYIREYVYQMEQYSFKDNTWNTTAVPYSFFNHAACVFDDRIYVLGGSVRNSLMKVSCSFNNLFSLDISSPNQKWEKKAPSLPAYLLNGHNMFPVCIDSEDVLLVVDNELDMWYYSLATEQWTKFNFDRKLFLDAFYIVHGMILCRENSLFVLNVGDQDCIRNPYAVDYMQHCMKDRLCLNLEISKKGNTLKNMPVENFPFRPTPRKEPSVNIFGAILAIPR